MSEVTGRPKFWPIFQLQMAKTAQSPFTGNNTIAVRSPETRLTVVSKARKRSKHRDRSKKRADMMCDTSQKTAVSAQGLVSPVGGTPFSMSEINNRKTKKLAKKFLIIFGDTSAHAAGSQDQEAQTPLVSEVKKRKDRERSKSKKRQDIGTSQNQESQPVPVSETKNRKDKRQQKKYLDVVDDRSRTAAASENPEAQMSLTSEVNKKSRHQQGSKKLQDASAIPASSHDQEPHGTLVVGIKKRKGRKRPKEVQDVIGETIETAVASQDSEALMPLMSDVKKKPKHQERNKKLHQDVVTISSCSQDGESQGAIMSESDFKKRKDRKRLKKSLDTVVGDSDKSAVEAGSQDQQAQTQMPLQSGIKKKSLKRSPRPTVINEMDHDGQTGTSFDLTPVSKNPETSVEVPSIPAHTVTLGQHDNSEASRTPIEFQAQFGVRQQSDPCKAQTRQLMRDPRVFKAGIAWAAEMCKQESEQSTAREILKTIGVDEVKGRKAKAKRWTRKSPAKSKFKTKEVKDENLDQGDDDQKELGRNLVRELVSRRKRIKKADLDNEDLEPEEDTARDKCYRQTIPGYTKKSRRYREHSKKINDLPMNQLRRHYLEIQPNLQDIFEGICENERSNLYLIPGAGLKKLQEISVSRPFVYAQTTLLITKLMKYFLGDMDVAEQPHWANYISYVLLPEALILIYARVNDLSYEQSENEMRFQGCYDGEAVDD